MLDNTRVAVTLLLVALLWTATAAASSAATEPSSSQEQSSLAEAPMLRLESIRVEAANGSGTIGAETLCKLKVLIANSSDQPAFSLAFAVEVGDQSLPVYEKQLFMVPVPPTGDGEPFELDLFNFWSSDSRRALPAEGDLEIKVSLVEAQWLEVSHSEEDGEALETWTPKGAVASLPSTQTLSIKLKR